MWFFYNNYISMSSKSICLHIVSHFEISFSFVAMEVLNYVGRADGKRGAWRTDKTEAR